jgi:16S rRNA processing protein RimM
MSFDGYLEVGKIAKAHGLKGEVLVHLETENPEVYLDLESVFVEIKQKLVPFFIEDIRLSNTKAIIKFEDFNKVEQTQSVLNAKIFLPREIVEELDDERYIFSDLIGYKIEDERLGVLGAVTEIYELPGQDLLAIQHEGEEVLLPMNDDFILEVDNEAKLIRTSFPEGILDLNKPSAEEEEKDED